LTVMPPGGSSWVIRVFTSAGPELLVSLR